MNPLVLRCLIYTYCNQKVYINWNGAKSTLFPVTNGVKQGGELLSKLRENGLGCHMNGQFVGTFINTDVITILALSHSSLRSMLTICNSYMLSIVATVQTFYRKCNEVRFDFSMLSSDIKSKLISTFCMELYGSQLWNYGAGYPETFYVAWRNVTRFT